MCDLNGAKLEEMCSQVKLCDWAGTGPSLLLHPLDFLGADDEHDLAFFPAINLENKRKSALVSAALDSLLANYTVLTMRQHALEISSAPRLTSFDVV